MYSDWRGLVGLERGLALQLALHLLLLLHPSLATNPVCPLILN